MTFQQIVGHLLALAKNKQGKQDHLVKGRLFERLIAQYLMTDPLYADRLEQVWLWSDWPYKFSTDLGIDLVARERETGNYWAIQCKFYSPDTSINKPEIDSFLAQSGAEFETDEGLCTFSERMWVASTDKWGPNAEKAIKSQKVPVFRISLKTLEESPVDWSKFDLAHVERSKLQLQDKKNPHEYQGVAITDVINGFKTADRGKLIMACGTGKTFTSLRLMEQQVPANGRVLFLAPSISLVSQSMREWSAQAADPIHSFVVCSDTKVGKDEEDISTHDLAYPATTDASKLVYAASKLSTDRRTVVFSTYQSIQVVADAQKKGFGEFDLIICDEAHRTTGITLSGEEDVSDFVKVHDNAIVQGKKRLYMTATPRIFAEKSKTKAGEVGATLYSMDKEDIYGPEFYRIGFGKAVQLGRLSEYKVLIVAVKEAEMAKLANNYNNAYKLDDKKAIDIRFATKIIGSWKGLSKQGLVTVDEDGEEGELTVDTLPMRRAVAFSKSIKDSQQMRDTFGQLVKVYQDAHQADDVFNGVAAQGMVDVELDHVDGGMNSLVRQTKLDWLKSDVEYGDCRILSNARCLSEGIDVPALDAVVFFDTRESIVDIVQSVGRVMRKADDQGKQYGYIILPVCIPSEKVKDYNSYIDSDPQFKGIWKVIKALRAHDESLVDEAEFRRKIQVIGDGDSKKGGDKRDGSSGVLPLDFPTLPLDTINEAVYAAIPKKLGDREYWADWAEKLKPIAERLITRINSLIDHDARMAKEFAVFLKGLQDTLNPDVARVEAVEMLAQHILTLPVFQALFADSGFPDGNVVAKALQKIVKRLDAAAVDSETEGLEKFYENVRERIALAKSDKSKQEVIRNLYDTFFHNGFPNMAKRLGIVYTPIPVVDFILNSVQSALQKHFGCSIGDRDVQVLDPFSGTGTFLVRLIQSGLISSEQLEHKYQHELHANEIVLLAYYIATVNIETAFHAQTGRYEPFHGMVLTDTFQMTEENDLVDRVVLPENNAKAERQLQQPIRVIVGNPPYSAKQDDANNNNKNLAYPSLDGRIANSYARESTATNKIGLYDSYIRAFRWASDRIQDDGIICFVTNGGWIDGNSMDGFRKCLNNEFSDIYVFNLRGDARTQGELRRKEAGNVFDSGSRTPVAITLLVKRAGEHRGSQVHYYDIGDYLSTEEKLELVTNIGSQDRIPWQTVQPDQHGDWINQRSEGFEQLLALNEGIDSIFSMRSNGIKSQRDAWVYNPDRRTVAQAVAKHIDFYNAERIRVTSELAGAGTQKAREAIAENLISYEPKQIKWTRGLIQEIARGKIGKFDPRFIGTAIYRPFYKTQFYYERLMNEMNYRIPSLFPVHGMKNLAIVVPGTGSTKDFDCLMVDTIVDLNFQAGGGQCFPLYQYESPDVQTHTDPAQGDIFYENFAGSASIIVDGFVRHEVITDWAVKLYRDHYRDQSISKEDIFYYVYGVLHSPEYRHRFAVDLRKQLPRIPLAGDFSAFAKAGRHLATLHLGYESVEPFALEEVSKRLVMESADYRVVKMMFGKAESALDRSVIHFNEHLILRGIPDVAYEYVVNGKSAIEWIMERYQVSTDPDNGITIDPNTYSEDPRYIVDLLKRIVTVSVETMQIVKSLPPLEEHVPAERETA